MKETSIVEYDDDGDGDRSFVHKSVNGPSVVEYDDDGDGDRSLVHKSVNGTSIMKQYVMVMCSCHRSVIHTSIEKYR